MTALEFRDLSVAFGHGHSRFRAVDGVNLCVPENTVVGLVGESGSGKSTLARTAVGLNPIESGEILLGGEALGPRRAGRRQVQMVFQDPYSSLNPRMSVGASIAEGLRARGRAQRRSETARLLELVGLDPALAGALPGDLSGGQRQRVALARGLAPSPQVLIADEVTSALDVSVQGAVLNLIRKVQRELAMSMLFISHNLAVVRYVSDVIAVMYLGRIVEVAPTEQLLADPQHPYTRALLETAPRVGVPLPEETADGLAQEAADPHLPPAGCRFHPRCPIGPLVNLERTVCLEVDPQGSAATRRHRASCHFADPDQAPGTA